MEKKENIIMKKMEGKVTLCLKPKENERKEIKDNIMEMKRKFFLFSHKK